MTGLLSEILYALRKKLDERATKELVSKAVPAYNPPAKVQRPFEADYPNGALADEQGRLLKTIDGHDITGRFVVGRKVHGGADEALTPAELNTITEAIVGAPTAVGSIPGKGDVGRTTVNRFTRLPTGVIIRKDLTPDQFNKAYAHEFGHVIDQGAKEIPLDGVRTQAERVYNTLNTGTERTRNLTGPQHFNYRGETIDRELAAEGIRAYATNPNYLKTVAPDFAKRIREYVNTDPVLSKIVTFNTAAPVGLLSAGYAMAPSDAEAAPQASQSTLGKIYDAMTTNPVGTFKAFGSAIGDSVKDYAKSVYNEPSKGAADALELGVTSLGGLVPQAFWAATSPTEANAGEQAILDDRIRRIAAQRGLLAD